MFKNPFQVAITFSILALSIKLFFFSMEMQHGAVEKYIIYIYMLILLVAIFFGIRSNKINVEDGKTTFGQDFKAGARTASFFAILVALITYVYYAKIDINFFEIKKQPILETLKITAQQKLQTQSKVEVDAFLANQLKGIDMYLSPYFQAMWTMFGLVFMGLFYSAVFSYMMRKLPGFKQL